MAGKTSSRPPSGSRKVDEKIADLGDWRGEKLSEVRTLIHEVDPDVVEEWKWMGSAVWSHEGVFAVARALKDKVRLTFPHGANLPDPGRLLSVISGGNDMRALYLREGDAVGNAALEVLVREAVAYNSGPAGGRPVLLSGGNPQIPKGDGDAPVQAYIAAMPGWKGAVGRRLDALIERNVPGVRKAVRWNSPFYGVEGQDWFLSFHVLTRCVKVTFFRGATLEPAPPGSSKDPDSRWIDIYEGRFDEQQMAEWVRQAAAIPGWPGF